jgi:lipopolysaccharide export system permease protein
MRRVTRYVVFEFLKIFMVTLFAMTVLMVFGVMGMEAVREGLSPVNVLRLIPYTLPMALLYAIPGTALFAVCSVFGRMSAANEVVAIKSLGISPMKLVWPVLTLAFVLSVAVVWLNDVAVSWGRIGTQRVIVDSFEQIAYGMLRTRRSYTGQRFSIHVKGVEGKKLLGPMLTVRVSDNEAAVVIMAEYAELRCDPKSGLLRVLATNGEVDYGERGRLVFEGTQPFEFPLLTATRKGYASDRPADTALRKIPGKIDEQRAEIARIEQSLASEAAFQMLTGDFHALADREWQPQYGKLAYARGRLFRLSTEPWRRWANGFSCLAFVVVGLPLSVRLRNSDMWTSFAACFLPILIVYYPLLAYGVRFAKSGEWPPYCVWLGNLVFIAIGCLLLRRVTLR